MFIWDVGNRELILVDVTSRGQSGLFMSVNVRCI